MKQLWITTEKLAEIKNISPRAVRKAISTNKYIARKCGKGYEILVTSLEENVREKITEKAEKLLPATNEYRNVPEHHKKLALAKYDLIKSWERFKKDKKSKTKANSDFLELYNRGMLHEELFKIIGKVAIGTIYEWQKELKNFDDDWHCLIKNYTFGEKTKKASLTKLEEDTFLKLLLHPNKINIGKAIKLTKSFLKNRGIETSCCDMTFRRFAKTYQKEHYDIWVLAREGTKALRDNVIPYIPRDISKIEVGEVLVGDGHELAFQVINPYTGAPVRATMVAYQDWKSTMLVGYEIMLTENTQCIASALRNAIINLGKVPKYCYQDNGKAFRAKYFIENGLSGLFTNLGIEPVFATPYNAKAKPIERMFREFQDSFEVLFDSYVGSSIENKPAYLKRNEKFHKKLHNEKIYTIEEVMQCIEKWVEFQKDQPCPNVKNKTIGEVFESGRGIGVNIDTLDDLMMTREIKSVRRNGVTFLNANYYSEELYGFRDSVLIRYSLFDLSKIKVYTTKGKFICTAQRVKPINPLANYIGDVKDIEDLKQKRKMQKHLEQQTERKYIQELKRQKLYLPLIEQDLPEKTEEENLRKFAIETQEKEVKNANLFINRFERYEVLIKKKELTESEKAWIKDYENSNEYSQIYGNDEVSSL